MFIFISLFALDSYVVFFNFGFSHLNTIALLSIALALFLFHLPLVIKKQKTNNIFEMRKMVKGKKSQSLFPCQSLKIFTFLVKSNDSIVSC